ncbi:hypothetical protein Tco_0034788 [Tanacetum coccineum]
MVLVLYQNGTVLIPTTAYHPQSDEQTEPIPIWPNTPIHTPYVAKDSYVELVDRTLQARKQVIAMVKFHLKAAQDRMKVYADKKRSDREFAVGDLVYLKLQP